MKKALVMIMVLCFMVTGCSYLTEKELTATVEGKERIIDDGSSKYLVFTDKEVLQNSDILIRGKFRSSDLYGSLKEGTTYTFRVCGWRIPFFSAYRNIISVKEK